jgi:transcriptional regulator with XRE-family HTH domain
MRRRRSPASRALGGAIRATRKEQGVSQEALALKCSLDRSYYGAIERGEFNITIYTLTTIAAGLQVPAWALMKRAADEPPENLAGSQDAGTSPATTVARPNPSGACRRDVRECEAERAREALRDWHGRRRAAPQDRAIIAELEPLIKRAQAAGVGAPEIAALAAGWRPGGERRP